MPVSVGWDGLEDRREAWDALGAEDDDGTTTVELWVELEGSRGADAEALVAAAAERAWGERGDSEWPAWYATASGPATIVRRTTTHAGWRPAIEGLVAELSTSSGRVTELPPIPADPLAGRVGAGAYLSFTVDQPLMQGPLTPNGNPANRWAVDPGLTQRLVEEATTWALVAGDVVRVSHLPTVPEDAARVFMATWPPRGNVHPLLVASDLTAERARGFCVGGFGLTSWTEVRPGTALADDARILTERLIEYAELLDYAHVAPSTRALTIDRDQATGGLWLNSRSRELWSQYVPAPYSIQLLTSAHLERTRDLSDWSVEQLTDDRWLVTAHDLDAWWDIPDARSHWSGAAPDPDLVAQARADFGDAILTLEHLYGP